MLGRRRRKLRDAMKLVLTISMTMLLVNLSGFAGSFFNNSLEIGSVAFAQTTSNVPVTGAIKVKKAYNESGYSYIVNQDFGTLRDTSSEPTRSKLRIFENGKELGAAHSVHADISNLGGGRFSYWGGSSGAAMNLYFSASDNTNPKTNGRLYTYRIDSESVTSPTTTTTSPTTTTTSPTTTTTSPTTTTTSPTTTTTSPTTTTTSSGRIFYVSPSGSDSNAGTAAAPWRTITAAALKLAAGDTAILMDGTYEEGQILFANSGTAGSPITIRAQNKWAAIVSSISGCNPGISIYKSYITIQDIRLSLSPNNVNCSTYSSANASIRAWSTSEPTASNPSSGTQGFTARGLLIDPTSPSRATGIKSNQDFSLIENCVIHNEIESFNSESTIIRNNVVYGGGPWGTYILSKGGARNTQIYGNIVHMTGSSRADRGILLGGAPLSYYDAQENVLCYNCVAYNNVVINETGDPSAALFGFMGAKNSLMFNNVGIGGQIMIVHAQNVSPEGLTVNPTFKNNIVKCGTAGLTSGKNGWDGYWSGTLTVDRNQFYNCTSGLPSQQNPVSGSPSFIDENVDWHLLSGSPALGSGVTVTAPGFNVPEIDVSRDKDGNPRSTPWNLGIY